MYILTCIQETCPDPYGQGTPKRGNTNGKGNVEESSFVGRDIKIHGLVSIAQRVNRGTGRDWM